MVCGLVASELIREEQNRPDEADVSADEAFEFFNQDGNEFIERGDLE